MIQYKARHHVILARQEVCPMVLKNTVQNTSSHHIDNIQRHVLSAGDTVQSYYCIVPKIDAHVAHILSRASCLVL